MPEHVHPLVNEPEGGTLGQITQSLMDATSGDPGGSRTPNPQIRSLMLYPVELRGRSMQTNVLSRAEKRKQKSFPMRDEPGAGAVFPIQDEPEGVRHADDE
jgi:hypothetical protein